MQPLLVINVTPSLLSLHVILFLFVFGSCHFLFKTLPNCSNIGRRACLETLFFLQLETVQTLRIQRMQSAEFT